MDQHVKDAAADIRAMRVRGAAAIGRHAAEALGELAASSPAGGAGFARDVRAAGEHLTGARPTAASLANAVNYVLHGLDEDGPVEAVARRAAHFVERSLRARDEATDHAAAVLEGPVVLTTCNSQAAVEAISKAHGAGRVERAICFETRPWRQGIITAKQLHGRGVPTTYMVDSAASIAMGEAGSCVVGSDTLVANGDVINKIGTKLLALAARDVGVPFHVCAETFKAHPTARTGADIPIEERAKSEVVDARKVPGVTIRNPVFDVTPARLITRVCTELGASRPKVAVRRALREWG